MVLLVSGKCSTGCFYCPLSLEKKGRNVLFANERRVGRDEEILEEAETIGALGTGVTGGDPVASLDLHAYRVLEAAGLDELRVHPPLEMWTAMNSTGLAGFKQHSSMRIGLEVPSIPGQEEQLRTLVRYAAQARLNFVNINELEFSEGNWEQLHERGLEVRDEVSSAVGGSEKLALDILASSSGVPVHYCSSSFKDTVQLRRRIMRRARRVARPSDLITEEGTLLKGVVEGPLDDVVSALRDLQVPEKLFRKDEEKKRVEVAPWVLEEIYPQLPYEAYLVEEYPTADRLEVEREPLRPR
jgi:pyruvate formate-lyase activating enzyme-like uncharacterized protein